MHAMCYGVLLRSCAGDRDRVELQNDFIADKDSLITPDAPIRRVAWNDCWCIRLPFSLFALLVVDNHLKFRVINIIYVDRRDFVHREVHNWRFKIKNDDYFGQSSFHISRGNISLFQDNRVRKILNETKFISFNSKLPIYGFYYNRCCRKNIFMIMYMQVECST